MERPPAVLCVQLKRFTLMGGKISKPVQLQRQTDLSPFIKTSGQQRIPVNYKLVAMITHVGPSPNCGHYTAIGEAAGGQFYQVGSLKIISAQRNWLFMRKDSMTSQFSQAYRKTVRWNVFWFCMNFLLYKQEKKNNLLMGWQVAYETN